MPEDPHSESAWDRSAFAMTSDELDVHQALSTLERVLGVATLRPETLRALRDAYEHLKLDPAR